VRFFEDEIGHLAQAFGNPKIAANLVDHDHKLVRFCIPPKARWSAIAEKTTGLGATDEANLLHSDESLVRVEQGSPASRTRLADVLQAVIHRALALARPAEAPGVPAPGFLHTAAPWFPSCAARRMPVTLPSGVPMSLAENGQCWQHFYLTLG
jgi:hypothetical protein